MEDIYYINQSSDSQALIEFEICGTTYPDKGYRIERKNSYIACIEYVEEGCGTVSADGKAYRLRGGDSYFLMKGRDQLYYSDQKNPWKKHFINLSGRLLDALVDGYSIGDAFCFFGLDIKKEILEIIAVAKKNLPDSTEEIIPIISTVFYKMHKYLLEKPKPHGTPYAMKDYLDSSLTKKFKLAELCDYVSKSESQAIRIFKKAFGMTPYSYVIKRRIELAKKLLDGTAMTVRDIAERLCFADEYYFSNLFKKKVGISPLAYRERDIQ